MGKVKSAWYCSECGHKEPKWTGQCSGCQQWNTFSEELELPKSAKRFVAQDGNSSRPLRLKEITTQERERHRSAIGEFDRLVGNGLVVGSLSLIAGEPGIGKSTLLLQVAHALSNNLKVLYVCGEESVEQTYSRAKRLDIDSDNLLFYSETQFSLIKQVVDKETPDVLIIDSIQIIYKEELSSAPGSVSQVRETATECMHLAKRRGITTFLVGHVTKAGEIAGPRVLEHLVDTVLYFEGDRHQNFRTLRAVKNRFGPTDEIAVFQMKSNGLTEVPNPSEIFIQERTKEGIGSVIIPTLEGTRPILVEAQALVSQTAYPNPSRKCTGIDPNRLSLLLAVLEKRLRFRLHNCDVFVSIAGGVRIAEPSIDLGVLLAVASSYCNAPIHPETIAIGEVGLGGEIRGVPRIESRVKEAARMGFSRCVIPGRNVGAFTDGNGPDLTIKGVDRVEEAIDALIQRH